MLKQDKLKFFNKVAIASGMTDLKLVQQFYYALTETIVKIMQAEDKCELPYFGTFRLLQRAAPPPVANIHNYKTHTYKAISFKTHYALKAHINDRLPPYQQKNPRKLIIK